MATPSVAVFLNKKLEYEFYRAIFLTRFVILFCVFETVPFCGLWWVGGLVFLFFVAPSLAVFNTAYAFNQDVSKWSTGAVTSMYGSKCTLSSSAWPRRIPLWCIVENMRQLEEIYTSTRGSSGHKSHMCYSFFVVVV